MRDHETTDLEGAARLAYGDDGPTPGCGPQPIRPLRVYRFVDDAYSHWFMQIADIVIDDNGMCVKHRDHPGEMATPVEIAAIVEITPEMVAAKHRQLGWKMPYTTKRKDPT